MTKTDKTIGRIKTRNIPGQKTKGELKITSEKEQMKYRSHDHKNGFNKLLFDRTDVMCHMSKQEDRKVRRSMYA